MHLYGILATGCFIYSFFFIERYWRNERISIDSKRLLIIFVAISSMFFGKLVFLLINQSTLFPQLFFFHLGGLNSFGSLFGVFISSFIFQCRLVKASKFFIVH